MRARGRGGKGAASPRPPTQGSLEQTALWHLARRALTTAQLRAILERKLARAARAGVEARGAIDVDAVLDKMTRLGFLDDARVAEARTSSLRARGASRRKITQKLRLQGVDAAIVDDVTRGAETDELEAARTYARKRRLGARDRDKALAALARQGFSYDVARRALAALEDDGGTG